MLRAQEEEGARPAVYWIKQLLADADLPLCFFPCLLVPSSSTGKAPGTTPSARGGSAVPFVAVVITVVDVATVSRAERAEGWGGGRGARGHWDESVEGAGVSVGRACVAAASE